METKKSKIIKIIVLIILVLVALFFLLKNLGYDVIQVITTGSDITLQEGEQIVGNWESEKTSSKHQQTILAISDKSGSISLNICYGNDSVNSIFKLDDFTNCDYDNEIVQWDTVTDKNGRAYASILPNDCESVIIDDQKYDPETGEITIDDASYIFKYIVVDLEAKDGYDYSIILEDEKGDCHYRPVT